MTLEWTTVWEALRSPYQGIANDSWCMSSCLGSCHLEWNDIYEYWLSSQMRRGLTMTNLSPGGFSHTFCSMIQAIPFPDAFASFYLSPPLTIPKALSLHLFCFNLHVFPGIWHLYYHFIHSHPSNLYFSTLTIFLDSKLNHLRD